MTREHETPPAATGGAQDNASGSPARKQIKNSAPRPQVQAGRKVYARSPLDRLTWLGQVAGDAEMTGVDAQSAILIARFINKTTGIAIRKGEVFARLLGIERRAWVDRLGRLEKRGHVEVRRRGPAAAEIRAVVWPACIPLNDEPPDDASSLNKDVQRHRTSSCGVNVQHDCTSSEAEEVQPDCASNDAQQLCTSSHGNDVQYRRKMMCSGQKNNDAKSDTCEPLYKVKYKVVPGAREFAPPEFAGFEPDYFGPGDGDEFLPDEPASIGEPPPPIESHGLDALAAAEASRPEPPGWQEHVAELSSKPAAAPKARPVRWVVGEL